LLGASFGSVFSSQDGYGFFILSSSDESAADKKNIRKIRVNVRTD
jgi:hypothetical protein